MPERIRCRRCGFVASQELCKACVLLEGLNRGLPKLGIGKASKGRRMIEQQNEREMMAANKLDEDKVQEAEAVRLRHEKAVAISQII